MGKNVWSVGARSCPKSALKVVSFRTTKKSLAFADFDKPNYARLQCR